MPFCDVPGVFFKLHRTKPQYNRWVVTTQGNGSRHRYLFELRHRNALAAAVHLRNRMEQLGVAETISGRKKKEQSRASTGFGDISDPSSSQLNPSADEVYASDPQLEDEADASNSQSATYLKRMHKIHNQRIGDQFDSEIISRGPQSEDEADADALWDILDHKPPENSIMVSCTPRRKVALQGSESEDEADADAQSESLRSVRVV